MSRPAHRDVAPALVLLALGAYGAWEAAGMSTLGRVFPTLASIGLILGSLALIGRVLVLAPTLPPAPREGTTRPLLLLGILAGWAILLPVLGFVPVSVAGAVLVMAVAEHERPGPRSWAIQGAALVALVIATALIFGRLLQINLP